MEDDSQCESCGAEEPEKGFVTGNEGGQYCFSCASDMPACDDCDIIIEDGDYHLCEPCNAKRDAYHGL